MGKVLEGANIKLTSVASSIETLSGMSMVKALSEGIVDADALAEMAQGSMRSKIDDLKRAMNGLIQPHQQMMLKTMLTHINELSRLINLLDAEIGVRMRDEVELVEALDEISGVGTVSARNSAQTWTYFPQKRIWRHGLVCVRGATRVPASEKAARHENPTPR